MTCLQLQELQTRIEKYWANDPPDYEHYLNSILPRELLCCQNQKADDGLPRLQGVGQPVDILAMMVGESLEPLLQLVCVLKPRNVLLILGQKYVKETGRERYETMQDLFQSLTYSESLGEFRPQLSEEHVFCELLEQDSPTAVFRALQRGLQRVMNEDKARREGVEPGEGVHVVDITGAKKSMVVGAFLYAAHSELPITYVDFDNDQYNSTFGRPYGFACKIRTIGNPYQAFALRDWERVRQLYHRYDFRRARELLEASEWSIINIMQGHLEEGATKLSLYDMEDIEKVKGLSRMLEMYEAWDSGDFREAYRIAEQIDRISMAMIPTAITQFGPNWFQVTAQGIVGGPDDFYANRNALQVYAADELSRIRRLNNYNQDYRSAFLRAGGLNEVIMVARVVAQFPEKDDREKLIAILKQLHTPRISDVFTVLSSPVGSKKMTVFFSAKRLKQAGRADLEEWVKTTYLPLKTMEAWWKKPAYSPSGGAFAEDNGWSRFLNIRNNLAHRYVFVSEYLARDAVRFVEANIEDFFHDQVRALPVNTEVLPWSRLCDLCHLDFLPPRLRDNIHQEVIL